MIRYGLVRVFLYVLFSFASLFLFSLSFPLRPSPSLYTSHVSAEIGNYFKTGLLYKNQRVDTWLDGIAILVGLLVGRLID